MSEPLKLLTASGSLEPYTPGPPGTFSKPTRPFTETRGFLLLHMWSPTPASPRI